MKEPFSIRFYLNHAKSRDGKAQIYARIIVNREKVEVSTKLFVKSDLWNEDAGEL
jgi:hypothetical protein